MRKLLALIVFSFVCANPQMSHADDYDFARKISDPETGTKAYGISSEHGFKTILTRNELHDCAEANRILKLGKHIEKEDATLSDISSDLKSIAKKINPGDTARIRKFKHIQRLFNKRVMKLKSEVDDYNRSIHRNPYANEIDFGLSCAGNLYYSSDK